MSRHEVKRFVYICDGMEHKAKGCTSTQVVDAINEKEADHIAAMRGWHLERRGWICNTKQHQKWARKVPA